MRLLTVLPISIVNIVVGLWQKKLYMDASKFVASFAERHVTRTNLRTLKLNAWVLFYVYIFGISSALSALRQPENPRLLSSLLPNASSLPASAKLGFSLMHTYINAACYFLLVLNLTVMLFYAFLLTPIIKVLK